MPMLFAFEALAPEMLGAEVFGAEALGTALGAEALMGLGAEALGAGAVGGAEAALGADAMAANAAAGGAGAGSAGINAAQVAAQQNAAMQLTNPGITGIPEALSPAQQAYQAASTASAAPGMAPGTTPLPAYNNAFPSVESFRVEGFNPAPLSQNLVDPTLAAQPQNASFLNAPMPQLPQSPLSQYSLNAPSASQGLRMGSAGLETLTAPTAPMTSVLPPPSPLEVGMDKAIKFAEKNPFTAMTGAYMGASALGLLNPSGATFNNTPYNGPLSKIRLSPDFKGTFANPSNFRYKGYAAGGGIMGAEDYDIPVGYAEGDLVAPPALPYPSRTTRSSDAFQVPGQPQDPSQFATADAYNDILRSRVINDTQTGRANDPMYGVSNPSQLETRANTPERGFGPLVAQRELLSRSNEGEFAVPGYGDLGQFAGSFDPANVPMGNNRFSPADQYKLISNDMAIVDKTAPFMPRDGGRAAMAGLAADSDAGRFGVPGLGDLGQFAGSSGGGGSAKPGFDEQGNATMAFAKGGSLSDSIEQYQKMLGGQQQAAPAASRDVGI